jgi:hypothetical protein
MFTSQRADDLGIQATLKASMTTDTSTTSEVNISYDSLVSNGSGVDAVVDAVETVTTQECPWMTHCSFGNAVAAQRWTIANDKFLQQTDANKCLARSTSASPSTGAVAVVACDQSSSQQEWNFGRVNETVWQVRDSANDTSCLSFNSTTLQMEPCHKESGDKTTPKDCAEQNCRFSGIIYQLWYLNSLGQMTSAITNIGNGGSTLLPALPSFPTNTPWCLATSVHTAPPSPPPPPTVDTSLPLQVWAGPLAGGDTVVLLLNTGNGTSPITAKWEDIGVKQGMRMKATDLWTGAEQRTDDGSISAHVGSHDCAVFRLSPQ